METLVPVGGEWEKGRGRARDGGKARLCRAHRAWEELRFDSNGNGEHLSWVQMD